MHLRQLGRFCELPTRPRHAKNERWQDTLTILSPSSSAKCDHAVYLGTQQNAAECSSEFGWPWAVFGCAKYQGWDYRALPILTSSTILLLARLSGIFYRTSDSILLHIF